MSHPELERCIEVIRALRHPKTGCPWDLEQTHETLLKYLIEEAYEFVEAVENGDPKHMEEEIGDVLFQVILHTTIGEEKKAFSLESAAKNLADKLVRRHPHVFTQKDMKLTSDEVLENWAKIKVTEKGERKYTIDEKYLHAPALESSFKIGKKSTTVNFDWQDHQQVMMKVEEEWQEVKEELPPTGQYNKERVKEEIGDLLFSVAQLARHLDLNPEECLRDANKKFIKRFQKVEDMVKASGRKLEDTPQEELEEYWVKVKKV
ncbi:nucleoside triphosphate pyrophosphohydrolase [Peredibacter starrii]|uniref:Nucleoside triphosphate pyrophosphohydrolase n=1 Tax=Peredibacter starrii TaxID=28202 RepID=A0AAX4HNZ7_9BACT|nr:nucleoside triphosphate pyrophosphohydrolase [Peredibacter starrii]WPU64689.1 nucleoside triphosphate pyrophosphohydrolase [Peredibacter starrii]